MRLAGYRLMNCCICLLPKSNLDSSEKAALKYVIRILGSCHAWDVFPPTKSNELMEKHPNFAKKYGDCSLEMFPNNQS